MGIKSVVLFAAGCVLPAIMAMPEPTPAARLEQRQAQSPITQVWSPSIINGMTVTWQSFSFVISGGTRTLISTNSNWGWCATTTSNCPLPTTCSNGTVYYPSSSSIACATENPLCGTELLFSTSGANSRLTRHACFPTTDLGRLTSIYLLTPPASQVAGPSGSSSSSRTPTPTPTPDPPSGTNVGAIVGGVVGGLAVLVIAIIAIFLLLRHRKKQRAAAAAAAAAAAPAPNGTQPSPYGGAAAMAQQPQHQSYYGQPAAGSPEAYNAKHGSFVDYPAGSPPPQYGNAAVPPQNYYGQPMSATSPHPDGFGSQGSSPAQQYGAPVLQPGQAPGPHTSYGAHELPAQSLASNPAAVELGTEKH